MTDSISLQAAVAGAPHAIAVAGASGRMGRMLVEAIHDADDCVLAGALGLDSDPNIGADAAAFLGHKTAPRAPCTICASAAVWA
jgi:4-hydroxy-tetrahydrodipicolinate reductase